MGGDFWGFELFFILINELTKKNSNVKLKVFVNLDRMGLQHEKMSFLRKRTTI